MCRLLEAAGFQVIGCRDHNEALPVLESSARIELMVTDIIMPQAVNGFALARMAMLERPSLKIVYMTGYYEALPAIEVKNALGIILRKPFDGEQLIAAVTVALDGRLS
jgi:DNA-binding NtrC family response regulator